METICYRECSKWPPCAWTHAPSRFRHWSMTLSTMLCCSPAHVSTSRCWFPGTVDTVCSWGGQTYNLISSSFRIQCAKNDWNRFIFDRVIQKIKMWAFLGHSVYFIAHTSVSQTNKIFIGIIIIGNQRDDLKILVTCAVACTVFSRF